MFVRPSRPILLLRTTLLPEPSAPEAFGSVGLESVFQTDSTRPVQGSCPGWAAAFSRPLAGEKGLCLRALTRYN